MTQKHLSASTTGVEDRDVAEDAPGNVDSDVHVDQPAVQEPRVAVAGEHPERAYREEVAEQLRLSRLRLYSYCMTLSACVLALMAFMYLVQGAADGDHSFFGLGVAFAAGMVVMLWGALRVTQLGESRPATVRRALSPGTGRRRR